MFPFKTESKNFTVAGLTNSRKSPTLKDTAMVNALANMLNRMNPFRRIGIEESIRMKIEDSTKVIAQCNAAIKQATYVKLLAEAELSTCKEILREETSWRTK